MMNSLYHRRRGQRRVTDTIHPARSWWFSYLKLQQQKNINSYCSSYIVTCHFCVGTVIQKCMYVCTIISLFCSVPYIVSVMELRREYTLPNCLEDRSTPFPHYCHCCCVVAPDCWWWREWSQRRRARSCGVSSSSDASPDAVISAPHSPRIETPLTLIQTLRQRHPLRSDGACTCNSNQRLIYFWVPLSNTSRSYFAAASMTMTITFS